MFYTGPPDGRKVKPIPAVRKLAVSKQSLDVVVQVKHVLSSLCTGQPTDEDPERDSEENPLHSID